jgi:PBP1b-binding outer membrane lipoprotein LpoB
MKNIKKLSLILTLALATFFSSCVSPEPNKDSYKYDNVAYVSTYKNDGMTNIIWYPKDSTVYINNLTDEIRFVDKTGKEIKLNGSYSVSFE